MYYSSTLGYEIEQLEKKHPNGKQVNYQKIRLN